MARGGLKTHRQVLEDDFAAVAQDLIARNVTSPGRLGIQGGSNGGLLMGVQFTQRPELSNAVDIQVPLLEFCVSRRSEPVRIHVVWTPYFPAIVHWRFRRVLPGGRGVRVTDPLLDET